MSASSESTGALLGHSQLFIFPEYMAGGIITSRIQDLMFRCHHQLYVLHMLWDFSATWKTMFDELVPLNWPVCVWAW